MPDRHCCVPGCQRRYRCSGYCGLHYQRFLVKGTVENPKPLTAHCSVGGCGRPHCARGWCHMHYYRWQRTGSLDDPRPRTDISYTGAHLRVIATRGPAKDHVCVDCGQQADEWSYSRDDPNQLVDDTRRPYSLDTARYAPRCRKCHRTMDSPGRKPCTVDQCAQPMKAKGLCNRHYQSSRRHLARLSVQEAS